jgi:DNA-binding transcriptional ArsR family regulator
MKFNFQASSSRIYDFLIFPRLLFSDEEKDVLNKTIDKDVIKDEYVKFLDDIKQKLLPYKEEISKYYYESLYATHDFANILFTTYPLDGSQDEIDYLETLEQIPEAKFKTDIINTIILIDEEVETSKNSSDILESEIISFINNLNINSKYKWNLLLLVQNPKKYLSEFTEFIKGFSILFNSLYNPMVEKINEVGVKLAKLLQENPRENIQKLTFNGINYNVIENESCDFYVSYFSPYSLRISNKETKTIMIWGYYLEDAFYKLNRINQDKLSQRVKVFKALGDKTRYETLKLISEGISSLKDIANTLNVSSATISYHINEFFTSGIVSLDKQSKKTGYIIDYHRLNEIIEDFKNELNFPK